MSGALAGAFLAGWLADLYGRHPVLKGFLFIIFHVSFRMFTYYFCWKHYSLFRCRLFLNYYHLFILFAWICLWWIYGCQSGYIRGVLGTTTVKVICCFCQWMEHISRSCRIYCFYNSTLEVFSFNYSDSCSCRVYSMRKFFFSAYIRV